MTNYFKKILMASMVVLLCTGLLGCGADEEKKKGSESDIAETEASGTSDEGQSDKVKIGVSLDNLDDPFWIGIESGMKAAQEELGDKVSLDMQIAQGDANTQNKQIEDMLTAGADAIVCVYIDKEAILQSVSLCNDKDIPFIYVDRTLESTDSAKVAWGVGTDDLALSTAGWEYMAEYARENNMKLKVLELAGSLTDDNVLKRRDGLQKVMGENSDVIEVVQEVPTEFNLEKALAGVTNALQANPEINCIFMHSDFLLAPTIQALEQADRYKKIGEEGHVILMPYSGASLSIETMKDGYAEMCFGMDVYSEGYQGIMAGYNLATGNTEGYEEPLNDDGFIITQDNLDEEGARAYGAMN